MFELSFLLPIVNNSPKRADFSYKPAAGIYLAISLVFNFRSDTLPICSCLSPEAGLEHTLGH